MIVLMLVNALLGYIAHYFRGHITGHIKNPDSEDVANKILGVMYVFPLSLLMYKSVKDDIRNDDMRYLVSYFLSFMSFGLGVVVGFWHKPTGRER